MQPFDKVAIETTSIINDQTFDTNTEHEWQFVFLFFLQQSS